MKVEIVEKIMQKLNRQMIGENRNVILFLDNAAVHPQSLIGKYNIKIVFLPKNTTSRFQPLDAGIIQSFKIKYRKKLMCYVISRITNDRSASEIVNSVDIPQAITWPSDAWKEVTTDKNCFAKCGTQSKQSKSMMQLIICDGEFEDL